MPPPRRSSARSRAAGSSLRTSAGDDASPRRARAPARSSARTPAPSPARYFHDAAGVVDVHEVRERLRVHDLQVQRTRVLRVRAHAAATESRTSDACTQPSCSVLGWDKASAVKRPRGRVSRVVDAARRVAGRGDAGSHPRTRSSVWPHTTATYVPSGSKSRHAHVVSRTRSGRERDQRQALVGSATPYATGGRSACLARSCHGCHHGLISPEPVGLGERLR